MASPVCGLRPMRALRFTTTSLPTPGNTNPFLACLAASEASSSRIAVPVFLVTSNFVAMYEATCVFVIIFAMGSFLLDWNQRFEFGQARVEHALAAAGYNSAGRGFKGKFASPVDFAQA